jgi:hypothetical protein
VSDDAARDAFLDWLDVIEAQASDATDLFAQLLGAAEPADTPLGLSRHLTALVRATPVLLALEGGDEALELVVQGIIERDGQRVLVGTSGPSMGPVVPGEALLVYQQGTRLFGLRCALQTIEAEGRLVFTVPERLVVFAGRAFPRALVDLEATLTWGDAVASVSVVDLSYGGAGVLGTVHQTLPGTGAAVLESPALGPLAGHVAYRGHEQGRDRIGFRIDATPGELAQRLNPLLILAPIASA